jgi:lipoprotein-anchoring transpeptidase ErfK/SrfK
MSLDAVVGRWIRINLGTQLLELLEGDVVLSTYPVSTATNGSGERVGSEQTPRGLHEVRELIGHGMPSGAVFVGRKWTGEVCTLELQAGDPERDWMLSRLIWLAGLEVGRNCGGEVDTFARYIYIHGTPDSEPVGEPHSHGCIRMRNADVIALFDRVDIGTLVRIDE